jgi:hypothetical protein
MSAAILPEHAQAVRRAITALLRKRTPHRGAVRQICTVCLNEASPPRERKADIPRPHR